MPAGSNPFVGSSKIKTGGSPSKAEASPKRCFIPKEYFFAKRLPNSDNPTNSNASSTLDAGSPKILRIISRFSLPVKFG